MIEKKFRIFLITIISFLEVLLVILLYFLGEYMYPYMNHLLSVITNITFFFLVDLIVIFISLMIYLYHLIRPINWLMVQTNIAKIEMALGVVISFFPLFATILYSISIYAFYLDGFLIFYFIGVFVTCLFLIPGVMVFLNGWKDRKIIKSSY